MVGGRGGVYGTFVAPLTMVMACSSNSSARPLSRVRDKEKRQRTQRESLDMSAPSRV